MKMGNAKVTYQHKLEHREGLMEKQKMIAKRQGQGSMRMYGYPPEDDYVAKKIHPNWMEGR